MNNITDNDNEIKFNNSFEVDQYILGECKKKRAIYLPRVYFLNNLKICMKTIILL